MLQRSAYVYVGVDVHKASHVAVMVDSYGDPIGKPMHVANRPDAFGAWVATVNKRANGMNVVYGLEDVHGLGRALATCLLEKGETVKFTNAYMTAKERAEVNKTDRIDALAIARITAKHVFSLPDASVDPLWLALIQTVSHRQGLVSEQTRIKNRIRYRLMHTWPDWETFFSEPLDSKAALAFWESYPSPYRVAGMTSEQLADFLSRESHRSMGRRHAERILTAASGLVVPPALQEHHDSLVRLAIQQLRSVQAQLRAIEAQLAALVSQTDYDFSPLTGVSTVLSAELIALIGDVTRFPTVDKFLAYTGIAPVTFGSGESEKRLRSRFGRRELLTLIHRIAVYQLAVDRKGQARNPEAKEYYERQLGEVQAALPAAKRDRKVVRKARLSLMRQQAKRIYRLMRQQKQEAIAQRRQAREAA